MTTRLVGAVAFAFALFAANANAQISWTVAHTDDWWSGSGHLDSNVCFTGVSCAGNTCTAAAIVTTDPNGSPARRITFFRSTDAGRTWNERPMNVPYPPILYNQGLQKVEQIDSLNSIAFGAQGFIVKTSDGGNSWHAANPPVLRDILDMDFADSLNGILIGVGSDSVIFTTSDGGNAWTDRTSLISGGYFWKCRSFGNGRFSIFKLGHGPIYTTIDNFRTVDSTVPIFDSLSDPKYHNVLMGCTLTAGDTLLAYGTHWPKDTNELGAGYGMIMRTIDGGKTWEKPFIYPTIQINLIDKSTSLDRDTIYAAGASNNFILMSTNRGASWQCDTILLDTSYAPYYCWGISVSGDGHPIASFGFVPFVASSLLVRGEFESSHVEVVEKIRYFTSVYPNPSSSSATIVTINRSNPYYVYDMLGREIMAGMLSASGQTRIDVSGLSRGIYNLVFDYYDLRFSAGKIVVSGE